MRKSARAFLIGWLMLGSVSPVLAARGSRAPAERGWSEERAFYKFRFNTGPGIRILTGANLSLTSSFPIGLFAPRPIFIGPVVDFTIFTPGYALGVLGGAWYELRVQGAPRLAVWLGLDAGMVFSQSTPIVGGPTVSAESLAVYADAALMQEVDDLVSVKAQFRPGLVGGAFAFLVNFCLSFRFY